MTGRPSGPIADLTDEAFKRVVDEDLRRKSPNERVRSDLAPEVSAALRSPAVVDRWFNELIRTAKSVDGQLAAREAEYQAKRATRHASIILAEQRILELDPQDAGTAPTGRHLAELRAETETDRAQYLRTRSGTLRFKSGLDECIIEARWLRNANRHSHYDSIVADERNYYAHQATILADAIRAHHQEISAEDMDASTADEVLWAVLEE